MQHAVYSRITAALDTRTETVHVTRAPCSQTLTRGVCTRARAPLLPQFKLFRVRNLFLLADCKPPTNRASPSPVQGPDGRQAPPVACPVALALVLVPGPSHRRPWEQACYMCISYTPWHCKVNPLLYRYFCIISFTRTRSSASILFPFPSIVSALHMAL